MSEFGLLLELPLEQTCHWSSPSSTPLSFRWNNKGQERKTHAWGHRAGERKTRPRTRSGVPLTLWRQKERTPGLKPRSSNSKNVPSTESLTDTELRGVIPLGGGRRGSHCLVGKRPLKRVWPFALSIKLLVFVHTASPTSLLYSLRTHPYHHRKVSRLHTA